MVPEVGKVGDHCLRLYVLQGQVFLSLCPPPGLQQPQPVHVQKVLVGDLEVKVGVEVVMVMEVGGGEGQWRRRGS